MFTSHHPLILTAALAAALLNVASAEPAKPAPAPQPILTGETKLVVAPMAIPVSTQVAPTAAADIRRRLANTLNDAVTVNGFDDLVLNFCKANRDRIAERPFQDHDKLNSSIEDFRRHFKSATARDFDAKPAMFDHLRIYTGYDQLHATMQIGPELNADRGPFHSSHDLAGKEIFISTSNIKTFPPGTLDEITLTFANEGILHTDWRLQLQNPTADALADSLIKHLAILANENLPKDSLAAHRLVAHHLAAALLESHPTPKIASKD